jgi:NADH:ubiquinone oxidoreductase subunit F (NADH-binding)
VRAWNTEADWAKGPELAGWSEGLLAELKAADLRGMGGAGIPATQKWKDVRDAVRTAFQHEDDTRAFIVVNGDESEPGTFKDRELLLRTPHLIVEGVILAGLVTDATEGFIFIRHEYPEQIAACRAEIACAEQMGVCGANASLLGRPFSVSVFVSPGGYICGEQSALIEAMSDRRGEPRNMPPKLETNGLEDLPTLVSNVETFAWAPYIALHGGAAYAAQGVNTWKGRRFFSVSGDVKRPGVYEVPMGMTLRELIYGDEYCQGIAGDRALKGFAPSGPSGGFLPAKLTAGAGLPRDHVNNKSWQALAARRGIDPNATEIDILDLELELNLFRALSPTQALGAGVVVYAEGRDMAEQALNSMEFYRNESCGKCVPCRLGAQKMVSLGTNLVDGQISPERWNNELVPLIAEMGKAIEMASICGLGRSVPVPLRTAINYFGDDVTKHLSRTPRATPASANGSKRWP